MFWAGAEATINLNLDTSNYVPSDISSPQK